VPYRAWIPVRRTEGLAACPVCAALAQQVRRVVMVTFALFSVESGDQWLKSVKGRNFLPPAESLEGERK
jgi:hypothetical protein